MISNVGIRDMKETPQEISLQSLWVAYVPVPPAVIAIAIFVWLGFIEHNHLAGLLWAIGVGLPLFGAFALLNLSLMGKRYVFHPDRIEVFRFSKLLRTIYSREIGSLFSIGNKDGFMIETKDKKRLRILVPSMSLRKRFEGQLAAYMKDIESQDIRQVSSEYARSASPAEPSM